jgi:hypothetical protein
MINSVLISVINYPFWLERSSLAIKVALDSVWAALMQASQRPAPSQNRLVQFDSYASSAKREFGALAPWEQDLRSQLLDILSFLGEPLPLIEWIDNRIGAEVETFVDNSGAVLIRLRAAPIEDRGRDRSRSHRRPPSASRERGGKRGRSDSRDDRPPPRRGRDSTISPQRGDDRSLGRDRSKSRGGRDDRPPPRRGGDSAISTQRGDDRSPGRERSKSRGGRDGRVAKAERSGTRAKAGKADRGNVCIQFVMGKCSKGDKCRDRHPDAEQAKQAKQSIFEKPCRNGAHCKRKDCVFQHPSGSRAQSRKDKDNARCRSVSA